MKKRLILVAFSLFIAGILVACLSEDSEVPEGTEPTESTDSTDNDSNELAEEEPVTISVGWPREEDVFRSRFADYVEEEFPHVTIDYVYVNTHEPEEMQELVAQGEFPDIYYTWSQNNLFVLQDLEIVSDLDPLIEKTGLDLERFDSNIIEGFRAHAEDGELYALPRANTIFSLHYNKGIFDLFGVDYPEDHMTWDEVLDLAEEVTRVDDGVLYQGINLSNPGLAYSAFGHTLVDPDTLEVNIEQSEEVRRYLDMIDRMTSIPGNHPSEHPLNEGAEGDIWYPAWQEGFIKEQNVAMFPFPNQVRVIETDAPNMNYGVATYPVWEGNEGISPFAVTGGWVLSPTSENPEVAFEIMDFWTSDDFQKIEVSFGILSANTNPEVNEGYLSEYDLSDINTDSFWHLESSTGPSQVIKYGPSHDYSFQVGDFVNSNKDVNEHMRELQEIVDEMIREEVGME